MNYIHEVYFQDHCKILRHLLPYDKYEVKIEAPFEICQKGLQNFLQCSRQKISKICIWLTAQQYILQLPKHITGTKRRRNAYFITDEGKKALEPPNIEIGDEPREYPAPPKGWIWEIIQRKWAYYEDE